ncbi:MAG: oxidoreductase [Deltaproteobacteria bacterium]|nr:oxidoreductase [Deltaproteobacteria bacterium]
MNRLGLFLLALAAGFGCDKAPSKLDTLPSGKVAGSPGDASLEERVRRLEASNLKYQEALEFLGTVYAQQKAEKDAEEAREPAPDAMFAVAVANDVKAGQVEGPPTALVTVVKAFDFACPYCEKVNGTLHELVQEYGGKVRVVYKNFVVHPEQALPAHLASCAAAKQGKYLAFKDAFWQQGFGPYAASGGKSRESLGADNILKIAGGLQLDLKRFKTDMDGADCKAAIKADMDELEKFKVGATPTFFINGMHVGGALPKQAFKQIIDEKLKVAEASGVKGGDYYDREILAKGEKQFRSKKDPKPN